MNSSFYSAKLSVDQLEDRAAPALLKASVSFILLPPPPPPSDGTVVISPLPPPPGGTYGNITNGGSSYA